MLADKSALVTGSVDGIGFAIADWPGAGSC